MKLKIQELRVKANLKQGQLAKLVGCSERVIQKWEKDDANPSASNICKLCEILKCDPNTLLGWEDGGISLSPDERQLVDNYRASGAQGRTAIAATADAFADKESRAERTGVRSEKTA